MMVPKKLKMKAPYVPAIPFLSIYLEKTKALIQKDIGIPMFMVALFSRHESSLNVYHQRNG